MSKTLLNVVFGCVYFHLILAFCVMPINNRACGYFDLTLFCLFLSYSYQLIVVNWKRSHIYTILYITSFFFISFFFFFFNILLSVSFHQKKSWSGPFILLHMNVCVCLFSQCIVLNRFWGVKYVYNIYIFFIVVVDWMVLFNPTESKNSKIIISAINYLVRHGHFQLYSWYIKQKKNKNCFRFIFSLFKNLFDVCMSLRASLSFYHLVSIKQVAAL